MFQKLLGKVCLITKTPLCHWPPPKIPPFVQSGKSDDWFGALVVSSYNPLCGLMKFMNILHWKCPELKKGRDGKDKERNYSTTPLPQPLHQQTLQQPCWSHLVPLHSYKAQQFDCTFLNFFAIESIAVLVVKCMMSSQMRDGDLLDGFDMVMFDWLYPFESGF